MRELIIDIIVSFGYASLLMAAILTHNSDNAYIQLIGFFLYMVLCGIFGACYGILKNKL